MIGLGAIQLGLLAACVVLFVPMGMAGWHLSRNKILFFSGALFVSLAVCVHLTPYFPPISRLLISTSPFPENEDFCISTIHQIAYQVSNSPATYTETAKHHNRSKEYDIQWNWTRSKSPIHCRFEKLGPSDASDLLNGSWMVVAGDSQARFFALSLLNLVLDSDEMDSVRSDLFKRHSDYQIVIDEIGMRLDFLWAPYVSNLTDLIVEFNTKRNYPDVLLMASGLWHMLHITNASDYGISLRLLRRSVESMAPVSSQMFWLGMPMLVNSMLNTEEKREKMNDEMRTAYDEALRKSKLLRESGGPLLLLDMRALSHNCGPRCTMDGMHYSQAVYESAVHIMLNALLIDPHQRL